MQIIQVPSPNFTAGRKSYRPEAIVIHIMEGSLAGTDSWFRNRASQVSAHYGVGKNGAVHQYVKETDTAWHAGRVYAPSWPLIRPVGGGGYVNPNYYTIGIEHEGNGSSDWTEDMYRASSELIRAICGRWQIPMDRQYIIGHREIYSLKTCPGDKVDIARLIALAAGQPAPAPTPPSPLLVHKTGKVTTRTRLNIRRGPDTRHAPVNYVEPGIQLAFDGYTEEGEKISGNGKWFFTTEGNWFWGGGVTAPV